MNYKTVPQICAYVKPIIDDYRKYQSHESEAVEALKIIFEPKSEAWKVVIDGGSFLSSFKKGLGKNRMRYLQKLLNLINPEWYKTIDFN